MQGKGFKEYLEWLTVGVFILLIIGMGARLTIGQEAKIGVSLNASNSSYTLEQALSVSDNTGAHTGGIFIDNDTQALFSDLTINAALTVTQTNSTTFTFNNETEISNTLGIFTQGAFGDEMTARPIGNLTITSNGAINVSANGTAVVAGGIAVGNVTDNLINNGTINVFGNVIDSSGQLMVGGVYAVNATNVVNNGNVTVKGTGGYVDYAHNNVPVGFEIKERLDNFTNTGNISVSIESINATAVGVRSYDIGYFNNTGNISVFANSTSGGTPGPGVVGVMAGKPTEFEGYYPGQMRTFVNSGNLTVTGYASGSSFYAHGVEVLGDENFVNNFTNTGNILVTAQATNGHVYATGVRAWSIGNFTNTGDIRVTAQATNGYVLTYGVRVWSSIDNFTNNGGISVIANGTDFVYASGVEAGDIGSFTGNGTIFVSATSSNEGVEAYGVNAGNIGDFRLERGGIITVTANGTNYAEAYGIYQEYGYIGNFTNEGSISVIANATGGNAQAYGLYYAYSIDNFTNNGGISVIANGTDFVYASGVEAGDIGSFTGNGTISVSATASNGTAGASGVSAYGNIDDFKLERGGIITVTASGTAVFAGGVLVGNVTDNLINNGTISVFGNVTYPSGQLMVGGVYVENAATNVVNNGNVTVNGTGGYVNYAENNVPAGFEIASLGNFTNTGNINVSIESINATAVGVRSYEIGYFNNTGNISVFTNSTSGDFSAVIGVMAGQLEEFEEAHSGHIGNFVNNGNLTVTGYASGGKLNAAGVAVFNGTIDDFQNLERIEVYGKNIGGNATVAGVYAENGIGNFTNIGNIIATSNASDVAEAYGVVTNYYINNLTLNNGTINVNATGTNGAYAGGIVAGSNVGNFTLNSEITTIANATNGWAEAFGIEVGGNVGNFTTNGAISVSANATNGQARASGVEVWGSVGNFTGNGAISVSANATNGQARASGVEVWGSVGNFTGNGAISVSATGTNGAWAMGVFAGSIGNFTNAGSIVASANGTDWSEAWGVCVSNSIDNFTNKNNINANAIGNSNVAAYGIETMGNVSNIGNFANEGNIIVNATATVKGAWVAGISVGGDISNFTNEGSIIASANGTSEASALGIYLWNGIGNFTNKGNINVIATSTNGNAEAYGVSASDIDNFTNNATGVINVTAIAFNGNATAKGVDVDGTISNFINSGSITANSTSTGGNAENTKGVTAYNIDEFFNNGTITAISTATGNADVTGVEIDSNATSFTNAGIITAAATGANATSSGVFVGNATLFTNTKTINVTANATAGKVIAAGVVGSNNLGNFTNEGNITVTSNATSGGIVGGVLAGLPPEIGGGANGTIGIFVNNGNLTVKGYTGGAELHVTGVAVFNGTIDEFQNLSGGRIEVYGNNIGGNATVYGVGAFKDTGGYGNLTNFINAGLINATAIGGNATSWGVYADDYIGNFTNTGNILVTAQATNGSAHARGVKVDYISNFTNTGSIWVSAQATNGYAGAKGVKGDDSIDNFTNTGNIWLATQATNGMAYTIGVDAHDYIGNFTNTGNIRVTAQATNGSAFTEGISAYGSIYNFTNTGNILVVSQATNGPAFASGVDPGNIGNFTNNGSISVIANGTDYVYAAGVGTGNIGSFTSNGTISVNAIASNGNATAYGILAGDVGNFTNAGTIDITATATNGTAKAYGLNVGVVDTIGNFTNNGTIKITATGKDAEATGLYAVFLTGTLLNDINGLIKVSAQGEQSANATGIYVEKAQTGSTILNKGLIDVSAISTSGSVNSIGIYLKDSNTTFTNNGTIKVYASGNVDKVAGIYVANSTVQLSNPGEVVVWGNVPSEAKIRTLYVDTGSNVTLKDKFAITFGAPGTGHNIAPIYVASGSALNLNSTTLVVRLWNNSAQYIVVNTPYSIIEYNGTVNGNWGGLEKGYTNPLINVTWYNSTITDKDAQIIFKYSALNNPEQALGPVSSITGGVIINSIMVDNVFTFLPISSPLIFVKGYQPIMLASSGVSDVGAGYSVGGIEYRGGMWFKPLYTYVDADDLGFDADAYGFNIGLGGFLTKNFSLGIYANYLRAEYDYSISSAKDGDSDIFSVGIAGMWKMMKDTYLRYNVYGFSSSNDYHGRTGFNFELKEKASYNMNGVHAEILIGKVYRGKLNIIPEIGIKYTYYNPESFWTKVYDSAGNRVSSWDRYYDPDNKHMWKGLVGVMVAGETKAGGIPVNLFAYGRLEQAFGENDISALNYMRSDPTRWEISKEINRTTFIVQLGGEFMLQKNLGLEISGRGDFNGDYSGYTGKVMLRYSW
ncbi:outer membrane autotransporter barrel domain protein [Thermodesulfobacterium geofontis OPF15]|uniref:Outer membrane autotransporter barrel domain protein n=1 Tax=Thermodesulfobacterium geofontis (strain OPF15) TaxID=795359 RepID=F8C628_THEGP|nr:autotransporter outer membrane beta-barrel domain-containing protein [Thermodesulfobacterium geofontis]AEH23179.1 outer membrane autotransporter barrel domain protein [Thermodesulfobacterium geofontis OPF15]